MSNVTNLILTFSLSEKENSIMNQICNFEYTPNGFYIKSIDDPDLPRGWYGGNKMFEGKVYLGAYNYLEFDNFVTHLINNVNWKHIEDVRLFVLKDEDDFFQTVKLVT